ncbi:hypothetical protein ACFWY9_27455 [Amycolatopsis sp. NPDC059027]|uniref:hypothetical protein n=1 Tax=unclassified Amycolatopsis TaxID=2618356 RepID=UPI00366ED7CF
MSDRESAEPDTLTPSEALDEDELNVDPLEAGVEPPEHWSAANRHGTTPAEIREGEDLGTRLAEEEPDVTPEVIRDRPIAATPAEQLDDSVDTVETAPAVIQGGTVADAIREASRG